MLKWCLLLLLYVGCLSFKYGDKTRVNKGIWIKNRVKNERQGKVSYFFPESSFDAQADEFMNVDGASAANVQEFDRVKRDAAARGKVTQLGEKYAAKVNEEENKKSTMAVQSAKVIYKFSAKNRTHHPMPHLNKTVNETYDRPIRRLHKIDKDEKKNNTDKKVKEIMLPHVNTSGEDTDRDYLGDHKCDSNKTELKVHGKKNTTKSNNYEKDLTRFLMLIAKSLKKTMRRNEDMRILSKKIQKIDTEYKVHMNQIKHKLRNLESRQDELEMSTKNISAFQTKLSQSDLNHEKNEQDITDLITTYNAQQQTLSSHQQLLKKLETKVSSKESIVKEVLNEIVKKQNNFVKILNQLRRQYETSAKFDANNVLEYNHNDKKEKPPPTSNYDSEPAKINMLPTRYINLNHLHIDDSKLLKDKATENIDDLVYKYYFNNTFIETTLKNDLAKVFNEKETEKVKLKRTEVDTENTILMPTERKPIVRKRRWIVHKYGKRHIGTSTTERHSSNGKRYPQELTDKSDRRIQYKHTNTMNNELTKFDRSLSYAEASLNINDTPNYVDNRKDDPYYDIASRFCAKIGQDTDTQSFDWCVEKVLRKLRSIVPKPLKRVREAPNSHDRETQQPWVTRDVTKTPVIVTRGSRQFKKVDLFRTESAQKDMSWLNQGISTSAVPVYTVTPSRVKKSKVISMSSTPYAQNTRPPSLTTYTAFFPGNDELELNLKQSDVKVDTAGNVYYDSFTQPESAVRESKTLSDILPDENSDSRFVVDPFVLEMQSKRRAYVRRYNTMLLKKPGAKKI